MQSAFLASCPVCGRVLFKGRPSSYIEGGCPKCKEYIRINYTEYGFEASVKINSGATPDQKLDTNDCDKTKYT